MAWLNYQSEQQWREWTFRRDCELALRMNSTAAAMALAELAKHDPKAAKRILKTVNEKGETNELVNINWRHG